MCAVIVAERERERENGEDVGKGRIRDVSPF
jgi:hypothetical protein